MTSLEVEEIVKKIIHIWTKHIESINVDGYSRKIESIDSFQMNKYYKGYPDIKYCYKVNFNFHFPLDPKKDNSDFDLWNEKLDKYIKEIGIDDSKIDYITNQGHRVIFQFFPLGFIQDMRDDKLNILGI